MANIQIVNKITAGNQQDNWNQSNGHNVFTLYDADLDMPKFILIVLKYESGTFTELGRMTKSPNADGYAHFDIQGILRGNLGCETDEPASLGTATESIIQIYLQAGYLDDSTTGYTITDFSPSGLAQDYYLVTNGTKRRDELIWPWENYAPAMVQFLAPGSGFQYLYGTTVLGKPLSDYSETVTGGASCITGATSFRNFNIGRDEDFTLSFINRAYFNEYTSDICIGAVGIRTWWFEFVSADGLNREVVAIPNIVSEGGGPWASWGADQGAYIQDEYNISRVQCGPSNPALTALWDDVYDGTYSHVYVYGMSHNFPLEVLGFLTPAPDCVVASGMTDYWNVDKMEPMTQAVKLTYVPAECNDFTHVQVKWKNSFGYDDYFTFTKRHDESTNIQRDTFTKSNANWSANSFSVDYNDRGTVNFRNTLTDGGILRTKYLTDLESEYLRNLLISTEVRAKIDGEWVPIVLTDNQWNKRTYRTDRLFQLEIGYEMANNDTIQF